jgi:hypothetical protein
MHPPFNFSFVFDSSTYLPNPAGRVLASNLHAFLPSSRFDWIRFDWIMPAAQAPQFLWIYWILGLLGEAKRNEKPPIVACSVYGRCTTLVLPISNLLLLDFITFDEHLCIGYPEIFPQLISYNVICYHAIFRQMYEFKHIGCGPFLFFSWPVCGCKDG